MKDTDPALLLYTDCQGVQSDFYDVISDGFEGELADRIPGLLRLMQGPDAGHALSASVMLVSWGHASAMSLVLSWAQQPELAPWHQLGVVTHRLRQSDGAWSMIADAVRTSRYATQPTFMDGDRIRLLRALLGLVLEEDFDRDLATAICSIDGAPRALAQDLEHAAMAILAATDSSYFDRTFQASLLLKELARTHPVRAREIASEFLAQEPGARARRELLDLV